jgi:hypothetical protein
LEAGSGETVLAAAAVGLGSEQQATTARGPSTAVARMRGFIVLWIPPRNVGGEKGQLEKW